jgi:MHS family proline/betaine transporter-like MFS transporter
MAGRLTAFRREHRAIAAVTMGSILEWYEIYLYIYWSPLICRLFFGNGDSEANLFNTFLIFALGFVSRPLGGILFGRLGDTIGRKRSLLISIGMMMLPTFVMGLMPTYAQIGVAAPILLAILRIVQSCPAGGEMPGAFCYLYESSAVEHRRYLTSWGAVGNQLGIVVSMLECLLLEHLLTPEQLVAWGWRVSFLVGGCIGLLGLTLRFRLHETPLFCEAQAHHQITRTPLLQVIGSNGRKMGRAILYCSLNSVGFYLISALYPVYFQKFLGVSYQQNMWISVGLLLATTLPLPLFGWIGDRASNKGLLMGSTAGILALLYPLHQTIAERELGTALGIAILFMGLFTCLSALIPYRFADLFPTPVRFTCVGLSYNLVDGIIGGFSPVLALWMYHKTDSLLSFYWILFISGVLSLGAFCSLRERSAP